MKTQKKNGDAPKSAKQQTERSVSQRRFVMRLFVSDETVASLEAKLALEEIGRNQLRDQLDLTLIDISREPAKALDEMVLVTPTLIIDDPPPKRRLVGTLRNAAKTLAVIKAS